MVKAAHLEPANSPIVPEKVEKSGARREGAHLMDHSDTQATRRWGAGEASADRRLGTVIVSTPLATEACSASKS